MKLKTLSQILLFSGILFSSGLIALAEEEANMDNYGISDIAKVKMSHRIEGSYSPYKYIELTVTGDGKGILSYEKYYEYLKEGEEKVVEKEIYLAIEEIEKLSRAYRDADFYNVEIIDLNKNQITVTDVGITTLAYEHGEKSRIIRYGYAEPDPFGEILRLYWDVIDEHVR